MQNLCDFIQNEVSLKIESVTLIWNVLKYEVSKYCLCYKLDDDWSICSIELENVLMSYKNDKLLYEAKICCDKPGKYCFQIQSVCKFGESKWSKEYFYLKSTEDEDFPDIDGQCDNHDIKNFYHMNDIITDSDILWALKSYGWIIETNSSVPAKSKSIAAMRLLQDITRMKYQSFNIPLQWQEKLGTHTAVNHPMDILHDVILKADFSLRSKLYQKLAFFHLSVPVIFPSPQDLYMNLSLKSIIVARRENDMLIEENVTKSPLCVISMLRIGQQAISSWSKSKLCNDLIGFNNIPKLGSCGFYSRNALSSNMNRKTSEGAVEGLWYHKLTHKKKEFSEAFSLLNLRGNALHHIHLAALLASASDVLFALCGIDMFKDEQHLALLKALTNDNSQSSLKKLVILMTKESAGHVRSNRAMFENICRNVKWKIIDENYHKLLQSLTVEIEETLEKNLQKLSLNERFSKVTPEYVSKNKAKVVSDSFLNEVDLMKKSNTQERAQIRKKLFPIQSTIKRYAEAQKKESRTRNLDQKYKYRDEIFTVRKEQFEIIKEGLPDLTSLFLRKIYKSNYMMRIRYLSDVKSYLDDWSFTHLSDVRNQYSIANKKLNLLKKKETKNINDELSFSKDQRDLQMLCDNLSNILLDISIGVETIIREIGGIYETLSRNRHNLNKELTNCMNMLPELAASLLLNGVALELLDGDGLSVPVFWLKDVFKVFKKSYKKFYGLKHEPRIFVLTVLGTQSSGKSTLLNTMFGIQFPVSAGRCTKGAYLQLIPVSLENDKNNAILVVDTEGLGAPEYKNNNTHDNEIATFVLGISDIAILNVRGELPNDIENFLEVSICALMRMDMVDFHPNVVFVHQNCDPSA
ncbi:interferon-induced very large GTPase 1-like [Hydra vulgaris]|uniref:Interferon-induced very large GTPase 1-like n=1 Tax=Hydra vulgaris TaxID=6087 RepID=A0ABM4B0W8_HYDVU